MSDRPNYTNNSQTIVMNTATFEFETLETTNGHATVVRFKLDRTDVSAGDVLVLLSGEGKDIHFHGFIGSVEDGYAVAFDRRGSLLPADTVQ